MHVHIEWARFHVRIHFERTTTPLCVLKCQQVRGTRGEHTEAEGGVYDISNKRRMGLTEYEAVKEMNDGIAELIKLESSL